MSYFSCDVNLVTVSFRNRQLGKARKEVRHGNDYIDTLAFRTLLSQNAANLALVDWSSYN
jgi:hypothetical protein